MLVCVGTYNRRVTIAVIALPLACIRGARLVSGGLFANEIWRTWPRGLSSGGLINIGILRCIETDIILNTMMSLHGSTWATLCGTISGLDINSWRLQSRFINVVNTFKFANSNKYKLENLRNHTTNFHKQEVILNLQFGYSCSHKPVWRSLP